jgi:hypothetical protein
MGYLTELVYFSEIKLEEVKNNLKFSGYSNPQEWDVGAQDTHG